MLSPSEYQKMINETFAQVEYPTWLPGLYDPIKYTMEAGGKRLRSTLLLAMGDALGADLQYCIWPAVGVEIFHNFTLVHDDVMDNADMRRGRLTVHKKWDVNTAILSGDAMVSIAFKCMTGCPPICMPEVIDRFGMMTMKVYEGQQLDSDMENAKTVDFAQYIDMIIGKTSALIAYPCAIGAVIGGAKMEDVEAIFNFGTTLGIAFQIQDDYLDVYGDPATFGKQIGGDILNDKKTWLWIIANDHKPEELKEIINANLSPEEKIQRMTALYDSLGLKEQGQKMVASYTDDAIEYLRQTALSPEARSWFENYAQRLVSRNK